MSETVLDNAHKYLDRALMALRDLGLSPDDAGENPIVPLLNQITELDEARVVVIARTLTEASFFNEVVREQIAGMQVGERYKEITDAFDSIRDDAKAMVDQLEDGTVDIWERLGNTWMKISRGDIADRFEKIRDTYVEVARDSKDQIEREHTILEAYRDFRGAMKEAEVMALEVLDAAEVALDAAKQRLAEAAAEVEAASNKEATERARAELARDERLRALQEEEKRYQIAKDLADNLTVGYNTTEVVMARLMQSTNAKERVYAQSVSFFSTNETVFTALKASFTGLQGLHESTETLEVMKEGMSKSLETLAEVGSKVQEAALKAGYGPTIRADAVKTLVDSVIDYQERSRAIIEEMRVLATRNAEEIRVSVEDGKKRLAELAAKGNALPSHG